MKSSSLQIENNLDNPDQRISEDISSFTAGILSLGTAFLSSIINFISFSFILWSLSPKQPIPGYMLWLTLLYCGIATFTIFKIGKPLVKLDFYKEKKESDFRYNLMRIIERKDEIALLNGEQDEIKKINQKFYAIKENYLTILFRNLYISTAQNIFGNAVNLFPLITAAPSFFSGAITLGVLMQISNAFSQVQDSLMLFASNYQGIASISATANRLTQFYESTEIKNDKPSALTIIIDNTCLETHRLCLYKPNMNTPLVKINFSLQPREKLIIKGESGIGKTTLIKTLAGIWPYATGEIKRPTTIEIMPQKPYFPVGTLKEAILYGNNVAISDDEILGLLSKLNLSTLYQDLNTHADWNAKLSLGEQQRLSIVRIILKKPQWLILDEPTASLDTENQKNAIYTLFKALPEAAILTISHSDLLIQFHDRVLSIGQKNSNAVMNYSLV